MKNNKKKSGEHYVDNVKFYEELKAHIIEKRLAIAEGREPPRVSNYLGSCIQKIATGFSMYYTFINYSYRDEMVADAIENCFRYLDRFDFEKYKNPFSYFTQCCFTSFLQRIQKEQKQAKVRQMLKENNAILGLLSDDPEHLLVVDNDYINENNYETDSKITNYNDNKEQQKPKHDSGKEKSSNKKKKNLEKFFDEEDDKNSEDDD